MAATMESLQKELAELKRDVKVIKRVLTEQYELSDEAAAALEEARRTPTSEYVDL